MTGFLLAYFAIYSLMHAFVYSRVAVLLPGSSEVRAGAVLFMTLMVFAPVGTRLFQRAGRGRAARACALAGYSWLGFMFYCFCGTLLVDGVGALFRLANISPRFFHAGFVGTDHGGLHTRSRGGAEHLRVFRSEIDSCRKAGPEVAKLPPEIDRLRIAQISDVHLGLMGGEKRMARIRRNRGRKARSSRQDGDFIDGDTIKVEAVAGLFSKIGTRFGKYAVIGDREVYAGLAESIEAHRAFGFTVLRGEAGRVHDILNIVGLDPAVGP